MTRHQPLIALVGNPNAGKSALFNALTGARQKIDNYPGVTVERKSGRFAFADGRPAELIDLPGSYSLDPTSPDPASLDLRGKSLAGCDFYRCDGCQAYSNKLPMV